MSQTRIKGLYCLVQDDPIEGTDTIETYDCLKKAVDALNFIKVTGYHTSEYGDESDKIYFNSECAFFVDREIYNKYGTVIDYEGITEEEYKCLK